MSLPAPHLDDRNFQSLVDDAKRMVQQRCPEWTDHNVSDPGVTLIETFAYMVDQLLWRLNRVPDRTYIKFLELIGLNLQPPSAARAPITFWLSAPLEESVWVPAGTQVATPRTEDEAITFTTIEDLEIPPSTLTVAATDIDTNQTDHTNTLLAEQAFYAFDRVPKPGDTLYVGLSRALPSGVATLRFTCDIEGVGVDPKYPPLKWEAWDGAAWVECELERDDTGGLNRPGDVVVHLPATHTASVGAVKQSAGWIRCVVQEPEEWQPAYSASPRITSLTAFTSGGSVEAVNAEIINDEIVGISEGVPAQRFPLRFRPVVPREGGYTLEVSTLEGWEEWTQVPDFARSGPDDRHFQIEETAGEVVFGPAVREPDGTMRYYGKTPEKGFAIRLREYRTGGGRLGNVARNTVTVLKSSVPFIANVTNRLGATGGTDGETIDNAKLRGPILLRTRQRAVTSDDYEHLAREATAMVGRAHCVPAGTEGGEPGGVRILLVPRVEDKVDGSLDFYQMVVPDETYAAVADYLESRRTIGARVLVESAEYVSVSVIAALRSKPRHAPARLEQLALKALYEYLHPLKGGPDGNGWPFGRTVTPGELFGVLQRVPGVEYVEQVRLYPADPIQGKRDKQADSIPLGPHNLVFSFEHQVAVRPA